MKLSAPLHKLSQFVPPALAVVTALFPHSCDPVAPARVTVPQLLRCGAALARPASGDSFSPCEIEVFKLL